MRLEDSIIRHTGEQVAKECLIIADPYFEARLKSFDPNLELVFDQSKRRWTILEKALDNSGYNIILRLEDDQGEPKPFGEWVFNKLFVFRARQEEKARVGVVRWLNDFDYQAERQKAEILRKSSQETIDKGKDDWTLWKKACAEFTNSPVSDVTAGYQGGRRR